MLPTEQIIEATEGRFAEMAPLRDANESALVELGPILAADADRVFDRVQWAIAPEEMAASLEATPATELLLDESMSVGALDLVALERIIGTSDIVSSYFLTAGVAAATAVGRIAIGALGGAAPGWGTGSMVSPQLLLTNNHVLGAAEGAASSTVDLGYELLPEGGLGDFDTFMLDPNRFFLTSDLLDFTLVAVADGRDVGRPLDAYGWNRLTPRTGKVLVGDRLNIVQHPDGREKALALRDNRLTTILDNFLHYATDTNPGSSGAPVFNDQWSVVALHHSGVPEKDRDGNWLAIDGSVWVSGMDEERIAWVANEGIRVSSIVAAVDAAALPPDASTLWAEAKTLTPPTTAERLAAAYGVAHPPRRSGRTQGAPPRPSTPEAVHLGSQVPGVQINIFVSGANGDASVATNDGGPPSPVPGPVPRPLSPPHAVPASGASGPGHLTPKDLPRALAELSSATERMYYDGNVDRASADTYYAGIGTSSAGTPTLEALRALVKATHDDPRGYRPTLEVYPWIDLRPNLKLASIYSGKEFDAAEMIVEDFKREAARERAIATEGLDPIAAEAAYPYNCEHVVPQSWFAEREPMRGDLHHLFCCEWGCNSFRGNFRYHEFDPSVEAIRGECGQRETEGFEPSFGKGAVARASLYVWLRYPDDVDWGRVGELARWLATIRTWHEADLPTEYELHRNAAIAERQGNRNPFIDHPVWASLASP